MGAESERIHEELEALFKELDTLGTNEISIEQLECAPLSVQARLASLTNLANVSSILKLLDHDKSGSITKTEFVDGLMHAMAGKPLEMYTLMRQSQWILEICTEVLKETRFGTT